MRRQVLPLALLAVGACASPAASTGAAGAAPAPAPELPGMDSVSGPLALNVLYPAERSTIEAGDSSFLFGSTGTGAASLTINGTPVRVWPNGSWIAWLGLPRDSVMTFAAEASTATDTARVLRTVRRPARFVPPDSGAWIDTTSFSPSGQVTWPAGESLLLRVRATPGSDVTLRRGDTVLTRFVPDLRGADVPWGIRAFDRDTMNLHRSAPVGRYAATLRGLALAGAAAGEGSAAAAEVVVINGTDTARAAWPLVVGLTDTLPAIVVLDDDSAGRGNTDGLVVARAIPGGTYTWFWPNGTLAVQDASLGTMTRLKLADGVHAWVSSSEVHALAGTPSPHPVVGSITVTSRPDRVVARIPLGERVPFSITEGESSLDLLVYGAVSDANWIRYGPSADSLVSAIAWSQDQPLGMRVSFSLSRPVWGYRTRYDGTDLILEIRRPPVLDPGHPLRNVLIVVDPGHPPAGATGPTGLREPVANLGIALKLRDLLAEAGASVVMTRTTDVDVSLGARTALADSIGADLLISVHNNALPDGVNPFTNSGTSVFYNHPRSIALARAVDAALVRSLGVRDLGYARGDLALVRPTWMPSILTEGLFIMLPEQEAALRSDAGQARYAEGVYNGVRAFLADWARRER